MQSFIDILMPLTIAFIMLGIGLELKLKDFKRVFFKPKAIITGLACQIILLPILALSIIYFWPMPSIYKIGVMLIAACPGGTASNLVTKMLKGRVALSVSLTAFNSFLILFTIPLIVELSYIIFETESQSFQLGFWETMQEVMFTVVLPVIIGIIAGGILNERTQRKIHKPLNFILPFLLLVAVISVAFFDESSKEINYLNYLPLFIPLIILNILTILTGFVIAKNLKLKHKSSFTIAIEMGLQNSVLALYIGNQLLENKDISLIAILYGSFSLISTFGIAYVLKKYWRY